MTGHGDSVGRSARTAIGLRGDRLPQQPRLVALALAVGYRIFVCDNLAFHGDFTPVTRKHTWKFDEMGYATTPPDPVRINAVWFKGEEHPSLTRRRCELQNEAIGGGVRR